MSFPLGKLTFPESEKRVQGAGLFTSKIEVFLVKADEKERFRRRFTECSERSFAVRAFWGFPPVKLLFPSPGIPGSETG